MQRDVEDGFLRGNHKVLIALFSQIRYIIKMRDYKEGSPFASVSKMLVLIAQLGILMIVPIVGCTIAGAWIGSRLHHAWIAVIGFVIGAVAGAQACYRMIRRMTADWPVDEVAEVQNMPGGPTQGAEQKNRAFGADFKAQKGERLHESLKENE